MTRADRLKAALTALVDERREEINLIQGMHGVEVLVTLDDAGCVEYVALSYEMKRHRHRMTKDRSHGA